MTKFTFPILWLLIFLLSPANLTSVTLPTKAPNQSAPSQAPSKDTHSSTSPILEDVTEESGIDFVHFNGMTGEFFLPEITGSGGGFIDYDNDGDLDLYLVQGAILGQGKKLADAIFPWRGTGLPRDRLYRNDLVIGTDGRQLLRFTDVTSQSRIAATGYGMGVATGDFNNDTWTDLYVTNLGSNQMMRNNGDGTFTDVTDETATDDSRWSTSAVFLDYDRDGWLDLFVTNYVDFALGKKRDCYASSSAPDYCGPDAYDPSADRLFHNKGNGTFEDVSLSSGIRGALGAGLGVIAADFNSDGWTDIYVANDGDPNQLWINQKSSTFRDEALLAGVALNRMGQAEAGMEWTPVISTATEMKTFLSPT